MTDETNSGTPTRTISKSTLDAASPFGPPHADEPVQGEVRRRRWRKVATTFGAAACLFSFLVGTVFGIFFWGSGSLREILLGHGFGIARGIITKGDPLADWTPEKQFKNTTSLNVLVLGIDHDYDNKMQVVKNTWGRSDAILMARVDFAKNTIDALTIPRDSAVRIPGYRSVHKINAAHSYGGPQLTVDTIKSVFGVQADAVVSVNFEGFQKLVDAIGGVDVNVGPKALNYDDNWGNLHVHLKPGPQHLDGYQAMGFVRIRKQDNDMMRSKRQHEFLESVRGKLKSPATFLALPRVVDTLSDNLNEYNITRDQMYTLMNFARTLPRENIRVETLPSIEGRSFVTIEPEKSKEVIQRLFFPNQVVALNIETPNMERSSHSPRRHRRTRRANYVRPTGGLSVETPPAAGEADSGKHDTAPAPRDDTSSLPAEPATSRATG